MTRVRLDKFDAKRNLDRGAPAWREAIWYIVKITFFLSALPWPSSLKCALLRYFGASIGKGVVIKPRVNIHFPWRLEVGDHAWIGEEVFILNFARVSIGAQSCVSQRGFLCTGNHDFRDEEFSFRCAPVTIGDGAWVGASVFVAPGVDIGVDAVVAAGSVVFKSLPAGMVCSGNPAEPRSRRWKEI